MHIQSTLNTFSYDTVYNQALFEMFTEVGVEGQYIELFKNKRLLTSLNNNRSAVICMYIIISHKKGCKYFDLT